jgi:hypothetical protein
MANVIRNGGLRMYQQKVDQDLELCVIPSSDSTILGRGDAVKTAGSASSIGSGPVVRTVSRISAGDAIYGVVEGFLEHFIEGTGMSLDRTHRPASTAMYAMVRPANNMDVYSITADGTQALNDVGLNANITGNGGGTTITDADTVSGLSTMELDTSTINTTATLQLKIIGFEDRADNAPTSANAAVLVTVNNAERSGGTGTAGA